METPDDGPHGTAATYMRHGRVATITYDRPEAANAVNGAMRRDLNAAWERFQADEEAWVAILTGAGDRHFCGGADLVDSEGSEPAPGNPFGEFTNGAHLTCAKIDRLRRNTENDGC